MRIFGMGLPEIIVILVIVCIIAGPALVKKLGRRGADTAKALKETVEEGAREAGADVDGFKKSTEGKSAGEKLEAVQDKVDERLQSKKDLFEGEK